MGNTFIVVAAVLATVVQGSSPLSGLSVGGLETASDIAVARNKTTEAFVQAIEAMFDSIEGDLSIDDAGNEYLAYLLKGYDYYFAVLPSYSEDESLQRNFESHFKDFVITLCKALDMAKSKNGTHLRTVTEINTIRTTIDVEPVSTAFFKLAGNSSIEFRTKLLAYIGILYSNIFGAMVSRNALNFGLNDEIPSSFRAGAIAAIKACSEHLYDSLLEDKKSTIVFPP